MLARCTFSSGALVTLELVKYFADNVAPRRSVRLVHKAVTSSTWMETPVNFVKLVNIFWRGVQVDRRTTEIHFITFIGWLFFFSFFLIDTKVFVCLLAGGCEGFDRCLDRLWFSTVLKVVSILCDSLAFLFLHSLLLLYSEEATSHGLVNDANTS